MSSKRCTEKIKSRNKENWAARRTRPQSDGNKADVARESAQRIQHGETQLSEAAVTCNHSAHGGITGGMGEGDE
jgi:hypothetical protein